MSSNPGFEPIPYKCEINAGFEMHIALVMARTFGSQALEAPKQALRMVPQAAIAFVEGDFGPPVRLWGNTGPCAATGEPPSKNVTVVTFVRYDTLSTGSPDRLRSLHICSVPSGKAYLYRSPQPIDQRRQLTVHAALGAAKRLKTLASGRVRCVLVNPDLRGVQVPEFPHGRVTHQLRHPLPEAADVPSTPAGIDAPPRTEDSRQVAPATTDAQAVDHRLLNHHPVITRRTTTRRYRYRKSVRAVSDFSRSQSDSDKAKRAGVDIKRTGQKALPCNELFMQSEFEYTPYVSLAKAQFVEIDLASGTVLQRMSLGAPPDDLGIDGDYLFALAGGSIRILPLDDLGLRIVGQVVLPTGGTRLSVGGGVAWAVTGAAYAVADVKDPVHPFVFSSFQLPGGWVWRQLLPNGSGLGVAAFAASVGRNQMPGDVDVYDFRGLSCAGRYMTTLGTPGDAQSLAIFSRLAYLADGEDGLQFVNYLAFDMREERPPTLFRGRFAPRLRAVAQRHPPALRPASAWQGNAAELRNLPRIGGASLYGRVGFGNFGCRSARASSRRALLGDAHCAYQCSAKLGEQIPISRWRARSLGAAPSGSRWRELTTWDGVSLKLRAAAGLAGEAWPGGKSLCPRCMTEGAISSMPSVGFHTPRHQGMRFATERQARA